MLALASLIELLRPWGNLALHSATGLFISTLSPSSGAAIALSYGAVILLQVALWLTRTLSNALAIAAMSLLLPIEWYPGPGWSLPLLTSALIPLLVLAAQTVAAIALVQATIAHLQRA